MPNQKERELKVGAACILRINGFTVDEIAKALGIGKRKARGLVRETEKKGTISHF